MKPIRLKINSDTGVGEIVIPADWNESNDKNRKLDLLVTWISKLTAEYKIEKGKTYENIGNAD